jgi:hypothetical protein
VLVRRYALPGDHVRLSTDEPLLLELAERLWEPAPAGDTGDGIAIEVVRGAPRRDFGEGGEDGDFDTTFSFEERLRWVHEPAEFRCVVPGVLDVHIDLVGAGIRAALAPALSLSLSRRSSLSSSSRSFLARTLLEAPVAVLLARRGWRALHAGAVAGLRGAVVVRGAAGAGKSTLVAAAHAAGLDVLGDESLLVSRTDPDGLASSVRELTLREDSAALLGLLSRTEAAFSGGEEKRRIDLFTMSRPDERAARRASTLLLGPRAPGPARLVPLSPSAFLEEFARGEIPQERVDGGAGDIARAWADSGGSRLDGASDLQGAVALLKPLVT